MIWVTGLADDRRRRRGPQEQGGRGQECPKEPPPVWNPGHRRHVRGTGGQPAEADEEGESMWWMKLNFIIVQEHTSTMDIQVLANFIYFDLFSRLARLAA